MLATLQTLLFVSVLFPLGGHLHNMPPALNQNHIDRYQVQVLIFIAWDLSWITLDLQYT